MSLDVVARTRDWLVAADPGALRLRMAGTTVATLALTLAVLAGLATLTGQPITIVLLGVVIAMTSSTTVTDPRRQQRALTTALLPLPAIAVVALGAVLARHRFAGDAVFVMVMMAAVYVRRFGPRGTALGMVTFISYFFALFRHAEITQLPALAVAVVLGVACTLLMRDVVVRDRPERELARLLRAFHARLGAVLRTTAAGLHASPGWGGRLAGIVAGELISPSRWYWAVITAVLVSGDVTISLVLIGGCLFFAFYLMQVSPAFMMFWITTVLALLYGMLGQFSVGLLLVRLEETAAGATIGIVVAYLVLPTSTRRTVGGNARIALNGVGALLCHAVDSLLGDADGARLLSEARELGATVRHPADQRETAHRRAGRDRGARRGAP